MSRDHEQEYQELEEAMRKEAAAREDAQACIHKCKNILAVMQVHYRGAKSNDLLSGLAEQIQETQRETDWSYVKKKYKLNGTNFSIY